MSCVGLLGPKGGDTRGLTEDLRGRQNTAAGNRKQRRGESLDPRGDLTGEFVDLGGESAGVLDQPVGQVGDRPVEGLQPVSDLVEGAGPIQGSPTEVPRGIEFV